MVRTAGGAVPAVPEHETCLPAMVDAALRVVDALSCDAEAEVERFCVASALEFVGRVACCSCDASAKDCTLCVLLTLAFVGRGARDSCCAVEGKDTFGASRLAADGCATLGCLTDVPFCTSRDSDAVLCANRVSLAAAEALCAVPKEADVLLMSFFTSLLTCVPGCDA